MVSDWSGRAAGETLRRGGEFHLGGGERGRWGGGERTATAASGSTALDDEAPAGEDAGHLADVRGCFRKHERLELDCTQVE